MKVRTTVLSILLIVGAILVIYAVSRRETPERQYTAEGMSAPEIRVVDALSGRKILSSELKGKVVFINFWATWCQPCRDEMPSMEKLFRHFMDRQDFVMITLLYKDSPESGLSYLKQNNYNFPLFVDADGSAAKSYGVTGVPETSLVDKKGILRKKVIGPMEWDSPEVLSYISGLLKE